MNLGQFVDPIAHSADRCRLFLLLQARAFHALAQCALDDATQGRGAFGGHVDVVQSPDGEFIQQFVQADEGCPTHVPMRLFDAGKQVEQFSDGIVQCGDGCLADSRREGVAGSVHKFWSGCFLTGNDGTQPLPAAGSSSTSGFNRFIADPCLFRDPVLDFHFLPAWPGARVPMAVEGWPHVLTAARKVKSSAFHVAIRDAVAPRVTGLAAAAPRVTESDAAASRGRAAAPGE